MNVRNSWGNVNVQSVHIPEKPPLVSIADALGIIRPIIGSFFPAFPYTHPRNGPGFVMPPKLSDTTVFKVSTQPKMTTNIVNEKINVAGINPYTWQGAKNGT